MRIQPLLWLMTYGVASGLTHPHILPAQQVQVQQPVIQQFTFNGAVTVPDRGGVLLGGTARNAQGRSRFGSVPAGTSSGRSTGSSSLTAHVRIHDFAETDEAILRSVEAKHSGLTDRERKQRALEILQTTRRR